MNIFTILILAEIPIAILGAWCILNEKNLSDLKISYPKE